MVKLGFDDWQQLLHLQHGCNAAEEEDEKLNACVFVSHVSVSSSLFCSWNAVCASQQHCEGAAQLHSDFWVTNKKSYWRTRALFCNQSCVTGEDDHSSSRRASVQLQTLIKSYQRSKNKIDARARRKETPDEAWHEATDTKLCLICSQRSFYTAAENAWCSCPVCVHLNLCSHFSDTHPSIRLQLLLSSRAAKLFNVQRKDAPCVHKQPGVGFVMIDLVMWQVWDQTVISDW